VDDLDVGRVAWITNLTGTNGKPTEDHRGVILTPKADCEAGKPIAVVLISTSIKNTPEELLVKVPKTAATGGTRQHFAICNWVRYVSKQHIGTRLGRVWGPILADILTKSAEHFEKLQAESTQS
jgi:mRNA-degrading endonuclease toxin of MazEF toxin-antitoxin module